MHLILFLSLFLVLSLLSSLGSTSCLSSWLASTTAGSVCAVPDQWQQQQRRRHQIMILLRQLKRPRKTATLCAHFHLTRIKQPSRLKSFLPRIVGHHQMHKLGKRLRERAQERQLISGWPTSCQVIEMMSLKLEPKPTQATKARVLLVVVVMVAKRSKEVTTFSLAGAPSVILATSITVDQTTLFSPPIKMRLQSEVSHIMLRLVPARSSIHLLILRLSSYLLAI